MTFGQMLYDAANEHAHRPARALDRALTVAVRNYVNNQAAAELAAITAVKFEKVEEWK